MSTLCRTKCQVGRGPVWDDAASFRTFLAPSTPSLALYWPLTTVGVGRGALSPFIRLHWPLATICHDFLATRHYSEPLFRATRCVKAHSHRAPPFGLGDAWACFSYRIPHELQRPNLYLRILPSATASSRAVGEPGTGASVVKDHPHDPVILSLLQDRPNLESVSVTWSSLDGTSPITLGWLCRTDHHRCLSSRLFPPVSHAPALLLDPLLPGPLQRRGLVYARAARAAGRAEMDCRVLTTGILDPERETSLDEVFATLELPARRFQAQLGELGIFPRFRWVHAFSRKQSVCSN